MENKELEEKFVDEKTRIEYRLLGDYYIPNITIPKARRTGNIGKYGRLKLNYMKKYKIPEYTEMLLNNELKSYLLDIEDECKAKIDILIKQMAEKENVNEELKANNQIEWVQNMNNIKSRVEEIVLNEVIYQWDIKLVRCVWLIDNLNLNFHFTKFNFF